VSRSKQERLAYTAAAIAAVIAAFGSVVARSELETTLLMVTAVITGLICFDIAMERKPEAFAPWLLLSLAPAAKTIPIVWQVLRSENGARFERYDHVGSALYGLLLLIAVALLTRPARQVEHAHARFDRAVIVGSAATTGLAGASIAFLYDTGFGSIRVARLIEAANWVVVGGLLAAVTVAAGRATRLSRCLTGILIASAAAASVLAFSVAGGALDTGWYAVLFAAFALSGALTRPRLGTRRDRKRRTSTGVVVALVAGTVAAAAAIAARGDRMAWEPGWFALGGVAMAMYALAMLFRPADPPVEIEEEESTWGSDDFERMVEDERPIAWIVDVEPSELDPSTLEPSELDGLRSDLVATGSHAALAKEFALASLREAAEERTLAPSEASTSSFVSDLVAARTADQVRDDQITPEPSDLVDVRADVGATEPGLPAQSDLVGRSLFSVDAGIDASDAPAAEAEPPVPTQRHLVEREVVAPEPAGDLAPDPVPPVPGRVVSQPESEPPVPPVQERAAAPEPASDPVPPVPARAAAPEPASDPVPPVPARRGAPEPSGPGSLSDSSIVAAAQAAAAIRTAPSSQRHSLAPLAQAHHFDPSTGLLSAAGLQHALANAFAIERQAAHVTIVLFTVRDLDAIEGRHGRLASAAVTREVAERVRTLMPDGTGARFGRAAYAVIFVGDRSDTSASVQAFARVMLQLRAPVEGGSLGDKIDVVASMAQCYEGETAATFVARANQGLAKAVQTPEPTFVAMP